MQLSVTKKVTVGFGLSFAILCVIGVVSYQNTRDLIRNIGSVANSYRLLGHFSAVFSLVQDIQTGGRGFVITGQDLFLEPYQAGTEMIHEKVSSLRAMIGDEPAQQRRMDALEVLIGQQLAYVNDTIELRKTRGTEPAMEQVRKGEGKRIMDNIRQLVREMAEAESNMLAQRDAEAERSARNTSIIIISGSILALLIVGLATLVVSRDMRERERLEKGILEISDREQQRIGQDLHDGLCQQLAGIAFMGRALQQKLAARLLPETADARRIEELVSKTVAQARALARGLHPVHLEANGLMSALEELAANAKSLFGVACRFRCEEPVLVADNVVATHLYRIAQEAVHNAIRHARPGNIEIGLATTGQTTALEVRDDGKGMPRLPLSRRGMGLETMRYRARTIGATLDIRRSPSGGTIVRCSLKIARTDPEALSEARRYHGSHQTVEG